MNAYGSESLGASQATDVLTSAVREGKLEADQLAGAMGAVLPMASNMGVQFHEVGAAFAAMSRTGTNASEAATQLNAIMLGIMKPTKTAADNMELLGLSSQKLRQQIKDEGLLSVMNTLRGASEQNAEAFENAFGSIRALRGILDLTGKSMDSTRTIFDNMNNTAGMTQTAFDATAQSAEFRLRKAMNSARESFAQLGSMLLTGFLPIFEDVSRVIQNVFNAFFNLDQGTQKLILGLGAIALALPSLITLFGSLLTAVGALLSPVGLVAGALAGIAYIIYKNWDEVLPVITEWYNEFVDLYNASELVRGSIAGFKVVVNNSWPYILAQLKKIKIGFVSLGKVMKAILTGNFGEFGKIMAEDTIKGLEIDAKLMGQIANDAADTFGTELANRLEKKTPKQIQKGLTNAFESVKGNISGFVESFIGDVGGGGGTAPSGGGGGEQTAQYSHGQIGGFSLQVDEKQLKKDTQTIGEAYDELKKDLDEFYAMTQAVGAEVGNAFNGMAQSMISSLGLAESGIQGFLGSMLSMIGEIISMLLANAVANAIAGATGGALGTGPAAPFTLPMFITTMVGGVMAAFAAIPKFADGGIVSGTTLGVMGEYTGAKQNPEVIAPLNKLEGMIGAKQPQQVNVGGEFRIQGQDLVVALQRAERNRSRLK
jgi:TP901 family phage tail tape measure protein